jgi:hypothetical protein
MQQVSDWLDKLGLGQYAQRFADNGVGIAALPHLTDQDLKDLGVLLAHRRMILAALGELVPVTTTAAPPQLSNGLKTAPSVAKSPWCSRTSSGRQCYPRVWT